MIDIEVRGSTLTIQVLRAEHQNDGCIIVFKGPLHVLKNFLREDQSRRIDHDLIFQNMTKKGKRGVAFAKKELDSEYAADLFR